MEIAGLIVILLYVAGVFIAFKLLKSFVKAFFIVGLVCFVLVGILSVFLYNDAMDLKANWPNSQKLLILDVDGKIAAGVQTTLYSEEEPILMDDNDAIAIQADYAAGDFENIKGNNYKVFVIKLDSLASEIKEENIVFGDMVLSKSDAVKVLKAENGQDELEKVIAEKNADQKERIMNEVGENFGSNTKVKDFMFGLLFQELVKEKGSAMMVYIFGECKKGNIIIYPETAIFKFMKYVPQSIMDKAVNIINKKGEA